MTISPYPFPPLTPPDPTAPAAATLTLRALDACLVEVGDVRVGPDAELLFAMLLYLAMERGKRIPRERVSAILWPGAADENARHCLRQTLYKIRQLGVPVETSGAHLHLDPDAVVRDFDALFSPAAYEASADGDRARLGEFLPGYVPRLSPAFTDWLDQQRMYVQAGVRRALLAAIHDARMEGRWVEVEALARRCLELDPLNEEATLALAEAAALSGAKAQALQILDAFMSELGPGAKEIRLPAAILRKRIAERLPFPRYAAGETAFMGRAESMALLAERLKQARSSQGGAVLVWGDAGLGKTRLAQEFTRAATLQGVQVQRHKCQPSDPGRPLSLFVDLASQLLTLPGALGCSPRSLTYLKRLTEHELDAAQPSEETREAEYLYASVRQSLFDLVDAVAGEAPLLLVVEDVHWLDRISWQVLREMIEWAATHPVLFLLTSQTPGVTPEGRTELPRGFERHRLPRLDAAAAAELVEALARTQPQKRVSPAVRDWCVATGDGNPLYLRELLAHGLERGVGRGVPPTLAVLIDERISRLSPTALRVFQASAILGNNSTLERLEALLERKAHELLEDLEELDRYGLLMRGSGETLWHHDLLASFAVKRLGETSARLLHRRVATILEKELAVTTNPTLLWECNAHWERAGELRRALELARTCGFHLLAVGLPDDSAEVFGRATALAESLDQVLELLAVRAIALRTGGNWNAVRDTCEYVVALRARHGVAQHAHDDLELLRLEAGWRLGEDLEPIFERNLACTRAGCASLQHRATAAVSATIFADNLGKANVAHSINASCAALMESGAVDPFTRLRYKVVYHTSFGDLEKVGTSTYALLQAARDRGSVSELTQALRYAAYSLRMIGDEDAALNCHFEAYELSTKYGVRTSALATAEYLLLRYMERGDLASANDWYTRTQDIMKENDCGVSGNAVATFASRLAAMEGNLDEAERRLSFNHSQVRSDPIVRRRVANLSAALWISTLRGTVKSPNDQLFRDTLDAYEILKDRGGVDFTAYVLAKAMREWSHTDADQFLESFLRSFRRERCRLSILFADLAER